MWMALESNSGKMRGSTAGPIKELFSHRFHVPARSPCRPVVGYSKQGTRGVEVYDIIITDMKGKCMTLLHLMMSGLQDKIHDAILKEK